MTAKKSRGLAANDSRSGRVLFPTNRNNLLRILAAGLLMPVAGFHRKYYADLLEDCPGRIPLLASSGLVSAVLPVVLAETSDIPVAIELSYERLNDAPVPALMRDGSSGSVPIGDNGAQAWAPSGVASTASIIAIHVRTEAEREEIQLNQFSDVPEFGHLLRVSPDLFEPRTDSTSDVLTWLRGLDRPDFPSAEQIDTEDRRAGAILLYAAVVPPDETELKTLGNLIAGKAPRGRGFLSRLASWRSDRASAVSSTTDDFLDIAIDTFGEVDRRSEWRPTTLLAQLRRESERRLSGETMVVTEHALRKAEAIVRNEVAFEGFRPGGSVPLKAVLLTLRQPAPEDALKVELDESGVDGPVRALTAGLNGLMAGRSMIPVGLRPPLLDEQLVALQVESLRPQRDSIAPPRMRAGVVVRSIESAGIQVLVLNVAGSDVVERTVPRTGVPLSLTAFDFAAARDIAVEAAISLGWHDSVRTTINLMSLPFNAERLASSEPSITVSGSPAIVRELDIAAFWAHVEKGELPSGFEMRIRNAAPAGTASTGTRRSRRRVAKPATDVRAELQTPVVASET